MIERKHLYVGASIGAILAFAAVVGPLRTHQSYWLMIYALPGGAAAVLCLLASRAKEQSALVAAAAMSIVLSLICVFVLSRIAK